MTAPPAKKGAPKGGADIPRIGSEAPSPTPREKFLNWLKAYATLLSVAGVLVIAVIGASTLLWQMTSARFSDTAARIHDARALVEKTEERLTDQIKDVKVEVGRVEVRLGARMDDMKSELRDASQDRKADMGILRQDIQALRQDISTLPDRP